MYNMHVLSILLPCIHTDGLDFQGDVITVDIPAGQTNVPVDIPIVDDNSVEFSEEFSISMAAVGSLDGVVLGNRMGTVTIIDDDGISNLVYYKIEYVHGNSTLSI